MFSLHLSRESPAEIWSRRLFCLTYVEPKHQNDKHNQAVTYYFQHLMWIFWVCWLSPTWYNVDCSQLMSWFGHSGQLIYTFMEHRPMRNLQHETLQTTFDTFNQSQHLLHTLPKSFLHFSCLFTFLGVIKHNMPKYCFFIFHMKIHKIFNTKIPQFWEVFFFNTLIYDSCHNTIQQLFRMILES